MLNNFPGYYVTIVDLSWKHVSSLCNTYGRQVVDNDDFTLYKCHKIS